MGREIRKVIANWEHPRRDCPHSPWSGGCDDAKRNGGKCYQPLYRRSYIEAITEWIENHNLWLKGEHPDQQDGTSQYKYYAQWEGNAPDVEYYSPDWKEEEKTWFQVYETVSGGTPVSPAFATREELIEYLVVHGDFWDQLRGDGGWSRAAATRFVMKTGWAPSMIYSPSAGIVSGVEGMAAIASE